MLKDLIASKASKAVILIDGYFTAILAVNTFPSVSAILII